ncbi:MAG: hypothetical protein M1165_02575 [Candidatus Pacearchaeota archaeon]|nr:hypothetical protein [Candidatus Pacearchaeota archaeon]MDE1848829.1 hypothetical protein [Nanoarchaeota archaeon]
MTKEMSDMEIALFWAGHIENPCTTIVNGREENIREFYLREAKETVMPRLSEEYAKKFLQSVIDRYA